MAIYLGENKVTEVKTMSKSKQIIQRTGAILFLIVALLAGISFVQSFLNGGLSVPEFCATLVAPWVLFLGFFIGDMFFAGKRIRKALKENKKIAVMLETIALVGAMASVICLAVMFRDKLYLSVEGELLFSIGEQFCTGKLSAANVDVMEYLSGRPGNMLYGALLFFVNGFVPNAVQAGFALQLGLLVLVLVLVYFLLKKIGGVASGLAGVCLVGGILVWKKVVYDANVSLLYFAFVLLGFLLLAILFAKKEEKVFSVKHLLGLILAAASLAVATMFQFRTVFLVIPAILIIALANKMQKNVEDEESILESKGIRCLIFFFVYGIVTVFVALLLAMTMEHTLRVVMPVDKVCWGMWLISPLDGILEFFYKLEGLFMNGNFELYGYGLALGILLLSFVQGVLILFSKDNRWFVPVHVTNTLLIVEMLFRSDSENGIVLVGFVTILGAGLFGYLCEVIMKKRGQEDVEESREPEVLKEEEFVEPEVVETVEEPIEEPVEEESVEEVAVAIEAEETVIEVEEEPVEEVVVAVEEAEEIEEPEEEIIEDETKIDSEEVLAMKDKLDKMETLVVSQQLRLNRMEEMMKEQRILARKRERRLLQELAIARNRGVNATDKTKR